MAKKKKSKELLLAEIAYRSGREDAIRQTFVDGDEEAIVSVGAQFALAKWKEQTGGKKKPPTQIKLARNKWEAEGRRPEGTLFDGAHYQFAPDGTYRLPETLLKNFGSGESEKAAKAGK